MLLEDAGARVMVFLFNPTENTSRYVRVLILNISTLYVPIHTFHGIEETNQMTRAPVFEDMYKHFSPIGQEYPFLQVSEIFLSRSAVSAQNVNHCLIYPNHVNFNYFICYLSYKCHAEYEIDSH